jgi:hypothetical protein
MGATSHHRLPPADRGYREGRRIVVLAHTHPRFVARTGEIYLARLPFWDVPGMQLRPVLLLTGAVGSVPEVLVAYI